MGGCTFETYADGADPKVAFQGERERAQYDYGHAGYTGTIAEKGSFVKITSTVMTEDEALDLAHELISKGDRRINDKWGPAGAIPVKKPRREVTVTKVPGGMLGDEEALLATVLDQARKQRKVRRGETAVSAYLQAYKTPASPRYGYGYSVRPAQARYLDGATAVLTLEKSRAAMAKQTTPDGWLFFGWASS